MKCCVLNLPITFKMRTDTNLLCDNTKIDVIDAISFLKKIVIAFIFLLSSLKPLPGLLSLWLWESTVRNPSDIPLEKIQRLF